MVHIDPHDGILVPPPNAEIHITMSKSSGDKNAFQRGATAESSDEGGPKERSMYSNPPHKLKRLMESTTEDDEAKYTRNRGNGTPVRTGWQPPARKAIARRPVQRKVILHAECKQQEKAQKAMYEEGDARMVVLN